MTGDTAQSRFAAFLNNSPDGVIDKKTGFTKADGLTILNVLEAARLAIVAPALSVGSWNGGH
ncbi:hypothetical protein [Sphingobium boeckii]|uniref:Uncharacterized protein n=1 Tax=Sphingobium boeckii TaxID=1082345 RepID=A0A7W9AJ10_9SPHN|nr:hypothetical protein [Sphingobium boeckii]MBB5686394.1 hypothetical protein [Sphingobium boeckii]